MNILKEADQKIFKILGRQKVKQKEYRKPLWLIEDGDLLHNTMTGELLQLDGSEPEEELIARYDRVPVDFDEISFIRQWREALQLLMLPHQKGSYTILPTTACNARCFYCYEKGMEIHTMSDELVQQVIEKIASEQPKKASLRWFGGEPLVGMKQIDTICQGLRDRGLEISSSMISNGYLFDEAVVKKAVELWNLKNIQITLDGTEEVYNSVKNYVKPKENPFQRVLRNIRLLTEAGVKVTVRLNLGAHNYADLNALVPMLETLRHKNLSVYCKTLFQERSEENDVRCAELTDLLAEKGLCGKGRALSVLSVHACMADNEYSVIIDPLGGLSKCEHHIFDGSVGNLQDGVNPEKLKRWKQYAVYDSCRTCPLFPSCALPAYCPGALPCFDFERSRRIEETKLTMRALLQKKTEEAAKKAEEAEESEETADNDELC